MIIRSRAPVRISFGGGGTDIPPYCHEYGGCVVSATINKYSYAGLETRDDQKIFIESVDFLKNLRFGDMSEITYNNELDLLKAVIKTLNQTDMGVNIWMRSDVPPRSGLGSSAAAFAAMIGLFNHMRSEKAMTNYEIAELAYRLEREELKIGGGYQDQYATVFGGINYIEFGSHGVRVNPIRLRKDHIMELEKHLVLAYAGERETSGDIIESEKKDYKTDKEKLEALEKTKQIAHEIRYALIRGDFEKFGMLLHESWETKKKHSALVSHKRINDIYDLARKNGAIGGKVSGAGGGGFMFFLCEPNKEHGVMNALEKTGAKPVNFTFDFEGLQTWEPSTSKGGIESGVIS
jgi:D-glycero-alpha-D-manno-heptose-7-phosphate kinase